MRFWIDGENSEIKSTEVEARCFDEEATEELGLGGRERMVVLEPNDLHFSYISVTLCSFTILFLSFFL